MLKYNMKRVSMHWLYCYIVIAAAMLMLLTFWRHTQNESEVRKRPTGQNLTFFSFTWYNHLKSFWRSIIIYTLMQIHKI